MKNTKLLIILDGWGHSAKTDNNAILQANTPVWDKLKDKFLHTLISASGTCVGLPTRHMGNSEVGHLNIGAGRVVEQDLTRINDEINNAKFFANPTLISSLKYAKDNNKCVHIMSLLSDGGVHSCEGQTHAMLKMASINGCKNIYLHVFTDGRDCAPQSAKKYIKNLEDKIAKLGVGKIASVIGRYFAMDRDNRWQRTQYSYELIANGRAKFFAKSALDAIDMAYKRGETDEFIKATAITKTKIKKNDTIIFMNYRADRTRQLTQALTSENFKWFSRKNFINTNFVCLTKYLNNSKLAVVYKPIKLKNVLGEYLSNLGMTQLRIAETEKYAHITFFLNGGIEKPFAKEERIIIKSPDVATYDLKPEMSAFELTTSLIKNIKQQKHDLIICNFANADMVGHSGKLAETIKAVETIDVCLGKIYKAINSINGEMLITADHGNAEQMTSLKTNKAHTAHTNNPVPLIFVSNRRVKLASTKMAALSDIAPSILHIMNIKIPSEMTGKSLFNFN